MGKRAIRFERLDPSDQTLGLSSMTGVRGKVAELVGQLLGREWVFRITLRVVYRGT